MPEEKVFYRADCLYFRGDVPCSPHKKYGVRCENCDYYTPVNKKILIIKLGAIGDVIRTTPLLEKINEVHPNSEIWWLTQYPDILPKSSIHKILPLNAESILLLENCEFDILYSLDKDLPAVSLAKKVVAKKKYGFTLLNNKPAPINELAEHKFATGLFDDVNKANKKSYLEEIFEICDWKFEYQEYQINLESNRKFDIPNDNKIIIGLNTGCGDRWVSRLWPDEYWIKLINLLQNVGYFPVLLGGAAEDEKNRYFAEKTGAYYPGYFKLKDFIALVEHVYIVISAVTMGMHLATALKKPLILMNNIFNKYEFELYGRGEIVEPNHECKCFFSPTCTNNDYFCLDTLTPEMVLAAVQRSVKNEKIRI